MIPKNNILLFLSIFITAIIHTMEPVEPAPEICTVCTNEIKADQPSRRFSCEKHPLHLNCYIKLCDTAMTANKKMVTCPTCRASIKFLKIGYTAEEKHQIKEYLRNPSNTLPEIIEDENIRAQVLAFGKKMEESEDDEDEINEKKDLEVISWITARLESDAIQPQISLLVQQYGMLDIQVNELLEKQKNQEVAITLLKDECPIKTHVTLVEHLERTESYLKELQEENRNLFKKLASQKKKKKKAKAQRKQVEIQLEQLSQKHYTVGIPMIKELMAQTSLSRAAVRFFLTAGLGYAVHKGARALNPESLTFDLALTIPACLASSLFMANMSISEQKIHKNLLKHLQE